MSLGSFFHNVHYIWLLAQLIFKPNDQYEDFVQCIVSRSK